LAREQLTDDEKGSAIKTLVKLFTLMNSLAGYHHNLLEMLRRGEAEFGPDHPWQYVLGWAGQAAKVEFTGEDLVPFVKARATDFVSRAVQLANRHQSLVAAFAAYGERRDALLARLKPDQVDGQHGWGWLTQEEMLWAAPRMAELNSMVGQLRALTGEQFTEAQTLCRQFGEIARAYFNDSSFPQLVLMQPGEAPPWEAQTPGPGVG
jgi:hypothetical protein